jgi:predicted DNA-binding protein (MmcQ/YjbR family)
MDNERVCNFGLALPHVTEKLNWEHLLVYFVGDKMFALTDMDGVGRIDR